MKCPKCDSPDHKVLETRRDPRVTWRRRRCSACGEDFITEEKVSTGTRTLPAHLQHIRKSDLKAMS